MLGEDIGVVARRTDHGDNPPGLGDDGDDSAVIPLVAQRLIRDILQFGVDGRFDGSALVLGAGQQRLEFLYGQRTRGTAEQGRSGRFDTAVGVLADGEEACDRRVFLSVGVRTLIGERVIRRVGFCEYRAVR